MTPEQKAQLTEQAERVYYARQFADQARAAFKQLKTAFEKQTEGEYQILKRAEESQKLQEAELRNLGLKLYSITGETKFDVCEIIKKKLLLYDPEEALKWTLVNARGCLELNTEIFESLAEAKAANGAPLSFVEIKHEPAVKIATDLAKHLTQKENQND